MKPKVLPCTECNTGKPVIIHFSKGVHSPNPTHLCKRHNEVRKGKESAPKFRALSPKPTGELALFTSIWHTRKHESFISGKKLHEFNVSFFAHVLSKKQHPKLRLFDRNIVLLTPEEHTLYDQGTEDLREKYAQRTGADWSKLYKLKEELLNEQNPKEG